MLYRNIDGPRHQRSMDRWMDAWCICMYVCRFIPDRKFIKQNPRWRKNNNTKNEIYGNRCYIIQWENIHPSVRYAHITYGYRASIVEYNNKHPAQIETEHECDKSEVLYLMPIAPHFYSRCQNPVCALFFSLSIAIAIALQTCSIWHFGVAGFWCLLCLFSIVLRLICRRWCCLLNRVSVRECEPFTYGWDFIC